MTQRGEVELTLVGGPHDKLASTCWVSAHVAGTDYRHRLYAGDHGGSDGLFKDSASKVAIDRTGPIRTRRDVAANSRSRWSRRRRSAASSVGDLCRSADRVRVRAVDRERLPGRGRFQRPGVAAVATA